MKILILATDIYTRGGIARHTYTFASALGDLLGPQNVDLLALLGSGHPDDLHPRFRVLTPVSNTLSTASKVRFALKAMALAHNKYNLVVCSHLGLVLVAAAIRLVYGTPFWVACYGIEAWEPLPLLKRTALRQSSLLLPMSRFTSEKLFEVHKIDQAKGIILNTTIPNHFEKLLTLPRTQGESEASLGNQERILLSVGSLARSIAYKGFDTVIHALPMILERFPNVRYVIVGEGDDQPRLEKLSAEHQLSSHVTFAGSVSDEELAQYYRSSDVFVLPSRAGARNGSWEGEGFGRVYIEAALAGKPEVGSRGGGAAEAVLHGETGILVDPTSVEETAGAIIELLADRTAAKQMGLKGQKWATENFTEDALRKSLGGLLHSCRLVKSGSMKQAVSLPFSSLISRCRQLGMPAVPHPMSLVALKARAADVLKVSANTLISLVRWCLWPGSRPTEAQNVCIYRIGNLGDIICALPAMQAVRDAYPNAKLTLLTSAGKRDGVGAQALLNGAPWLDDLVSYYIEDMATLRQRWRYFKQLRSRKFDAWIELSRNRITLRVVFRNMLAARLAGARWAYGWRISTIRWAAQAQSECKTFPNEVARLLHVTEACGIIAKERRFPLPLTEQHALTVDAVLKDFVPPGIAPVAIAPGAKRPTNRWPPERYAEVAQGLAERGFFVLFLGGPGEQEICQGMASRMGPRALSLAGRLSPLESCEALKRCAFVVCNDSGVQHMAAAVSTPCVSIFSFQDQPGKWHPYGPQHIVLQKYVPCHTCFLEYCPHDNLCVKLVEVSEVLEATRILAERQQAR